MNKIKYFLVSLLFLVLINPHFCEENTWSQWADKPTNGISAGISKLSTGVFYYRSQNKDSYFVTPSFEYLASDYLGLGINAAIPVSVKLPSVTIFPILANGKIHLVPRFP